MHIYSFWCPIKSRKDPVLEGQWMNSAARTLIHDEAPDISKHGLNLNTVANKSSLG